MTDQAVSPDPKPLGRSRTKYLAVLWGVFLVIWIILCIRPKYLAVWWTENALVLGLIAVLLLTRKRFPLSVVSHTLIVLFLTLHAVGAHYSYSEVPYNHWWQAVFGRPLSGGRNHYDRMVHFCYGFLL